MNDLIIILLLSVLVLDTFDVFYRVQNGFIYLVNLLRLGLSKVFTVGEKKLIQEELDKGDHLCYNRGIYDVDSFKSRMENLKKEFVVEDYDGIPLYNLPVIKAEEIELPSGVEIITEEYEISQEQTAHRRGGRR